MIKRNGDEDSFQDYKQLFIQRIPKFGFKKYRQGAKWTTINKGLFDKRIEGHLAQKYAIAVLGRWYPEYALIDIDDLGRDKAERIKEKLSLDENNSMLCSSESKDSFHLLIKPQLNEKPPTLKRLNTAFMVFCKENGIEIYPQENRVVRLPFGR